MATCPDWILPVDEEGVGSGTLEMDVEEGPHGVVMFSRMGEVTVSGRKFYVVQRDFELLLDKSQITVNSKSQSGTLAVTTEESVGNWDVLTDVDWIMLAGPASGYGDGQIDFNLSENTTGKARRGRIIVAGAVCTVIQNAPGVPLGLEISGPDSVLACSSATYSVQMRFEDGSAEPAVPRTWSVSGGSGSTIRDGLLSAGPTNGVETLSVSVEYAGKTYTANKPVDVLARPVELEICCTPDVLGPGWTVSLACRVSYADGRQSEVRPRTFHVTRGDAVLDEDGFLSLGVQAGEVEVVAAYEENGIVVEGRMSVTVHPTVLPQNALGEFETWLSVHGIALDRQAALSTSSPTGKRNGDGTVLTLADEFIAGLDPNDPASMLRVEIQMLEGEPHLSWTPDLGSARRYRRFGATRLEGADWREVNDGMASGCRFFKVSVELK